MFSTRLLSLNPANRNGVIGFGCSLGFLLFVIKFNEFVQRYKARKKIKRDETIKAGLFSTLLRIFSKTCNHRELCSVSMLSCSLLLRTFGSVWVSSHWGKLVKMLVTRNFSQLRSLVIQFAGTTIGLAILNALLRFYIAKLREQVREKITCWCHEKYMRKDDMVFYKANKVGDEKLEHSDHQITSDIDKFADSFSSVLSQSLKPIVDFVVYSVELSRVQGLATPLSLYAWFAVASCISTVTLPPYGELAAEEQRLEGRFRGAHSELITNCEQVTNPEPATRNHKPSWRWPHVAWRERAHVPCSCQLMPVPAASESRLHRGVAHCTSCVPYPARAMWVVVGVIE